MGSVILIVICVIVFIFIALSIFSRATGNKRTANMEEKYNNIFNPLMERVREKNCMGDESLVVKIITDTEDGVLAVRDDEKRICALAWKDDLLIFPFSDYKECTINSDVGIIMNLKVGNEVYPISISSGKFKSTGIIGKQLYSMVIKMKNFLDEIID